MDKISVVFPKKNRRSVAVGESKVNVEPYISIAEQANLVRVFIEDCFNDNADEKIFDHSPFDRFAGEISFNIALLDRMTSIDITEISLEEVLRSGVMKKIVEKIDNYGDVIRLRETILQDILDERYSIMGAIKSLSNINLDDIQEMGKAVKDLEEKVQERG